MNLVSFNLIINPNGSGQKQFVSLYFYVYFITISCGNPNSPWKSLKKLNTVIFFCSLVLV